MPLQQKEYGYFPHSYFGETYFPAVWFAPAMVDFEPDEEERIIGGGKPFKGKIPKTKDDTESRRHSEPEKQPVYPKYHPWIHAPEEIKREIEKAGAVEPEVAEAVIEAVETVATARTVQNAEIDTALAEKEFRLALQAMSKEWEQRYAQLILLEYERREQEYQDAQIALMLFEM